MTDTPAVKFETRYRRWGNTAGSWDLDIEDADGEMTEVNLLYPCQSEPKLRRRLDGGVEIGYLTHDDDCENPLQSGDCQGNICDRRGRGHGNPDDYWLVVKDVHQDPIPKNWRTLETDALYLAYEPLCVLFDVHDHGEEHWYQTEGNCKFPGNHWDLTRAAAVWVPDRGALENIWYRTAEKCLPSGTKLGYGPFEGPHRKQVYLQLPGQKKRWRSTFECLVRWAVAQQAGPDWEQRELTDATLPQPAQLDDIAQGVAEHYANSVVKEWNDWLRGDCWGFTIEYFDAALNFIKDESHWGRIGEKEAEEELEEQLDQNAFSERISHGNLQRLQQVHANG